MQQPSQWVVLCAIGVRQYSKGSQTTQQQGRRPHKQQQHNTITAFNNPVLQIPLLNNSCHQQHGNDQP